MLGLVLNEISMKINYWEQEKGENRRVENQKCEGGFYQGVMITDKERVGLYFPRK